MVHTDSNLNGNGPNFIQKEIVPAMQNASDVYCQTDDLDTTTVEDIGICHFCSQIIYNLCEAAVEVHINS